MTTYLRLLGLLLLATGCAKPLPPPGFGDGVPLVSPHGARSAGPRLNQGDGRIVLSWIERSSPGGTLWFAELSPAGWSDAASVVTDPAMFVNWADLPSVRPLGDERWFAHWLSFSADGAYSYDVRVSLGEGREPRWGPAITPHDDGTPTEHGFVSTLPADDGVRMIWLDGRNTLAPAAAEAGEHAGHGSTAGGMTLRAATIGPDGTVSGEQEIDNLVCDCCQTDVAAGSAGPLAVYRDRTGEETRDIYLSRHQDGNWQPGERFSFDDWTISACPVNGPAVAAHDELVVVAWFTAANDKPLLKARVSKDGGATFGEPLIITRNKVVGHADAVAISADAAAISWVESGRQQLDNIRVRSVTSNGQLGPVQTVGRTALGRVVPQLAIAGDNLVLAWSDELEGEHRLSSVLIPIVPGRSD